MEFTAADLNIHPVKVKASRFRDKKQVLIIWTSSREQWHRKCKNHIQTPQSILLYIESQDLEHSSKLKQAAELCLGKEQASPRWGSQVHCSQSCLLAKKGPADPETSNLKIAASVLKPVFLVPNSPEERKGKVVYLGGFLKAWDDPGQGGLWLQVGSGFRRGPSPHKATV